MISLVNINNTKDYDIYIGRGSIWGNPFTHIKDKQTLAKYIVKTRKDAMDAYEHYILYGEGKHLLGELHLLKNKVLGCFCVPKSCHGEILIKLANNL